MLCCASMRLTTAGFCPLDRQPKASAARAAFQSYLRIRSTGTDPLPSVDSPKCRRQSKPSMAQIQRGHF